MKNKFFQKVKNRISSLNKKKLAIFLTLAIILVSFSLGNFASANAITNLLSDAVQAFFNVIFKLIGILIAAVIGLARYSGFTTSAAVVSGWIIVRDICNLFFIIILLVIAFSTILGVGGYSIKSTLPKLLLMAVLINFSKTICGIIIDVAQIVMLSFLAPLKDVSDWGFSSMFGVRDLESFNPASTAQANDLNVLASYVLGFIMLLISAVVLVVFICVLVMRIVMLWIYVAISPLAYFLSTFPQGAGFAKKWWSEFTENVIIGPVLAFFLWLSFVSVGSVNRIEGLPTDIVDPKGLTTAFSFESLTRFAISIGMLMGGLMISQSMAGNVGKIAGTGLSKINAGAGWAKKKAMVPVTATTAAVGAGLGAAAGVGLATAKKVDRIPGVALGAVPSLGKSRVVEGIARKGMIGGTAGVLSKVPEKISNTIRNKIDQNYDLYTQMRANKGKEIQKYKNQNGVERNYKVNRYGKLQEWDKDKSEWAGGIGEVERGEQILKKKSFLGGQKDVGEMSNVQARWHEMLRSTGSVAQAARFDAEDKKAENEKGKIVRFDEDQLHSLLASMSSSGAQKRAAAEILAERGKFSDLDEINEARKVFGGNGKALGDFNDKVNAKQAHKAYDFTKESDINKFHGDIEKGKIDMTKFDRDSLSNKDILKALKESYGSEFSGLLKKVGDSASSKKDRTAVGRAYETASQMYMEDAASFVQEGGNLAQSGASADAIMEMDNKANESRKMAYNMSKEHAKFTGEVDKSFAIEDGKVNIEAVKEAFKKFKPKDFESMSSEGVDKLINKYGEGNATKVNEIKKAIADSLSVSTLSKMASNGDQADLTKRLVEIMKDTGHEDRMRGNQNLNIVLNEVNSGGPTATA